MPAPFVKPNKSILRDIGSDGFYLRLFHHVKVSIGVLHIYPKLPETIFEENVDESDATATDEETEEYLSAKGKFEHGRLYRLIRRTYITFFALAFVHNNSLAFFTLRLADFKNPEESLIEANSTFPSYKFACIQTNCSHLSAIRNLAHDLSLLPVFKICHDRLSSFYSESSTWNGLGVLIMSSISSLALMFGAIIPLIIMNLPPFPEDFIMFIVSPSITTRITRENQMKVYLHHLAISYFEYSRGTAVYSQEFFHAKPYSDDNEHQIRSMEADISLYLGGIKKRDLIKYLVDSLPMIRTPYWQVKLAKSYVVQVIVYLICMIQLSLIILIYIFFKICEKEKIYEGYVSEMESTGCALWIDETSMMHLDIKKINLRWSPFNLVNVLDSTAIILSLAMMILTTPVVFISYLDIIYYILSLRYQIYMAIEMVLLARIQSNKERMRNLGNDTISAIRPEDLRRYKYDLNDFRQYFIAHHEFNSMDQFAWGHSIFSQERTVAAKISRQKFVVNQMIRHGQHIHVEMIEKLLLNLHYLLDHKMGLIGRHTRVVQLSVINTYVLASMFVCASIYCHRKFRDFTTEPTFGYLLAWIVCFIFISVPSNLSSQARKVETLLWILVANMNHLKDKKSRHLRLLLFKLCVSLDKDHIVIKVLGFKISYVNILQMIGGSITLFLFALQRDIWYISAKI